MVIQSGKLHKPLVTINFNDLKEIFEILKGKKYLLINLRSKYRVTNKIHTCELLLERNGNPNNIIRGFIYSFQRVRVIKEWYITGEEHL